MSNLRNIAGKPTEEPDVVLDVAFMIDETFYYGPSNGMTHKEFLTLRDPIYKPKLPIRRTSYGVRYVLAQDALQERDELHKYYASILAAAKSRCKEMKSDDPEFWLRLVAWDFERELTTLMWPCTPKEAEEALTGLFSSADEQLFWDIGQNSEALIEGQGDLLWFLEGDPHDGEVRANFTCDRRLIAAQAKSACANLRDLISWLSKQVGKNYWDTETRLTLDAADRLRRPLIINVGRTERTMNPLLAEIKRLFSEFLPPELGERFATLLEIDSKHWRKIDPWKLWEVKSTKIHPWPQRPPMSC